MPRGEVTFEEAASAAALRQRYQVRQASGERVAIFEPGIGQSGGWAVLFSEQPDFEPSCLNRIAWVKPVDDAVRDVAALVLPVRAYLQTCGVALPDERKLELAEELGRLGLDRISPLGRMADVAPTWHHDGHLNLLPLLRWTDLEPEGTAGRWEFSHPDEGLYGK